MAIRSKEELKVLIQTYFPTNDAGLITAENTRSFLNDAVDSLAGISANSYLYQEDSTTITNINNDNEWTDINNDLIVTSDIWSGNNDNTMTYGGINDRVFINVSLNFITEINNREILFKLFLNNNPLPAKAFVQGSTSQERQATWTAFANVVSGDVISIKCLNKSDDSDVTIHEISGVVGEI